METPLPPGPAELLSSLNQGMAADFVARLGGAVEHAPWVAQQAWQSHPFESLEALETAMTSAIRQAPRAVQLDLLLGHPELAGREAQDGAMTAESTSEQARLGLLSLRRDELERLHQLNHAYRCRFGIPLIVALALHDSIDSVFAEAEQRLQDPPDVEWETAIGQVCAVMRARLRRMASAPIQSLLSTEPQPVSRKALS